MKRRILLVGTPQTELSEVAEELASLAPGWDVRSLASGLAALDLLTREPCDAVVTDVELPDLTGLQLLNQVLAQWPQCHRVILTDLGDLTALLGCVGGVHQFLSRPCDAGRLKTVLERAFTLDLWLPNQALRALLGRLPRLPSPADDYHAVVAALERGDLAAASAGIAADPPCAAKVLQLANSAAYGPPVDEADPVNAVRELGRINVRRMLLLAHTPWSGRELNGGSGPLARFWPHSHRCAALAGRIAALEGADAEVCRLASTAGLLHDLGKLALAVNLPQQYREATRRMEERGLPAWEAEQETFGAHHGEVGGSLLGLWGLPMPVVEAVALHHHPASLLGVRFSPLTAVHIANALEPAGSPAAAERRLDLDYLAELGLAHRVRAWWQCREQALAPETSP